MTPVPKEQETGVCPRASLDISERIKSPATAGIRDPDRPDPSLEREIKKPPKMS